MIKELITRFHNDAYAPLSFELGLNIHKIHLSLPPSHELWDKMASQLADHISTFRIKELLKELPVLPADAASLSDNYLLRASIIVSGFAHAYYYPDGYSETSPPLPPSVRLPMQEIAARINKRLPHSNNTDLKPLLYVGRTYLEDFLGNWAFTTRGEQEQEVTLDNIHVNNLKLLVPYFNNQEEDISTLIVGPLMQARFAPAIHCISEIEEELNQLTPNPEKLSTQLKEITRILKHVKTVFLFMTPKLGTHYVDQIIWPQTSPTIGKKAHCDEMPNTGADSPIFHILDKLLNRELYHSHMGKKIKERFTAVTIHYQELILEVEQLGIKLVEFIKGSHNALLKDAFADLALQYAGPSGLLEAHRKKAYGYIKMSFLSGRLATNGNVIGKANTTTNKTTGLTPWGELNVAFLKGMEERLDVLRRLGIDYQHKIKAQSTKTATPEKTQTFKRYHVPAMNSDAQWIAIYKNQVIDLTTIAKTHPGGHRILSSLAGTDITIELEQAHHFDRGKIVDALKNHCLGTLEEEDDSSIRSETIDNWTMILFLIAAVQNNIKNIWFFDKKEMNDRNRYMPFQFVMNTLDILFGSEGYLDSLFNRIDPDLANQYREWVLIFIKETERPIQIIELGRLARELGLHEIKNRNLKTTADTEVNRLYIYKLYSHLVNECLLFLESLKIQIMKQLDAFSQEKDSDSIEKNKEQNEKMKAFVWIKIHAFIEKIDVPDTLKQLEPYHEVFFSKNDVSSHVMNHAEKTQISYSQPSWMTWVTTLREK